MAVSQLDFEWTRRQFVGGALILDFVNTVLYQRSPARRYDRLASGTDAARWWAAAAAHEVEAQLAMDPLGQSHVVHEIEIREALLLRDLARSVFGAVAEEKPVNPREVGTILAVSSRLLDGAATISRVDGGSLLLRLSPDQRHDLPTRLAASAMTLLFRGPLDRIRACPTCDWLFLDQSRNRSRKWCDMETCGNRAKAERLTVRLGGARASRLAKAPA
jgi:predicted RNA-binding Zn ribbon-like protein